MLTKTKIRFFQKISELIEKGRKIDIKKVGKQYIMIHHDTVGCRDYQLRGTYSYNQVVELNKLTGYNAGFGYSKELGPIAFIGVPNSKCVQKSGYFKFKVQEYGQPINEEEYYFQEYSKEDAKKIVNYTVYGMGDPRNLIKYVPIEKVDYCYDSRHKNKQIVDLIPHEQVLDMDIKLEGTYGFYEARKIAYGTRGKFEGACGENVPIQFAIVGNKQPVGIINMWNKHYNSFFKDVWGINDEEPKLQPIHFITDEEAKSIPDFKLYYFTPCHSYGRKKLNIEKVDRTLSGQFNFITNDGDYRLQDYKVPQKKLVKEQE